MRFENSEKYLHLRYRRAFITFVMKSCRTINFCYGFFATLALDWPFWIISIHLPHFQLPMHRKISVELFTFCVFVLSHTSNKWLFRNKTVCGLFGSKWKSTSLTNLLNYTCVLKLIRNSLSNDAFENQMAQK